ncbi:MAG: acylphosphatase [Actinobacteria bacterium]|nr:acylphosphatase [Actinomycetota bacterium]
MSRTARHLQIRGRVQGVFFRASSRERAREVGATGWVRNCRDGSVELWVEGEPDAVETVVDWVHSGGPRAARVEDVESDEREPEGLDDFEVRH